MNSFGALSIGNRMAVCAAAGLGFLLQMNLLLKALGLYFLHITDPIALAGAALLPIVAVRGPERISGLLLFFPLTLWAAAVIAVAMARGDADMYNRVHLLAYAYCGAFFMLSAAWRPILLPFCVGTTLGALASLLLLVADAEMALPLARLGLAMPFDPRQTHDLLAANQPAPMANRLVKAGGIWIAGNEAGPALALAAPAAVWWSERRRTLLPFIIYAAAMLTGFLWTQNRSSLLVVCLAGSILLARTMTPKRYIGLLGTVALIGAGLLTVTLWRGDADAEDLFPQRLSGGAAVTQNLSERMGTTQAGIAIATENPMGMSYSQRAAEMRARTGLSTTHNGFVSSAFYLGLPFAFLAFLATLFCLLRGPRGDVFAFNAAVALLIGFCFEELHSNPVFEFHIGIVLGAPLVLLAAYWRRRYGAPLLTYTGRSKSGHIAAGQMLTGPSSMVVS